MIQFIELIQTTQHLTSSALNLEQIIEGPQFRCGYWYLPNPCGHSLHSRWSGGRHRNILLTLGRYFEVQSGVDPIEMCLHTLVNQCSWQEFWQLFPSRSICQRGIRTEIIEGESINYLSTIGRSETRSTSAGLRRQRGLLPRRNRCMITWRPKACHKCSCFLCIMTK